MTRSVVAALVFTLAGCSEVGVGGVKDPSAVPGPAILLDPPSLEYGTLSRGETEVKSFTAQNVGDATLHVTDVEVSTNPDAFTVVDAPLAFDLEPGEVREIEVEFKPAGADENFGEITVASDAVEGDPNVSLLGFGAVPDLVITPGSYVFGDAFVPCGDSVELDLENVGTEDLEITGMEYESGHGLLTVDPASIPAPSAFPIVLRPGQKGHVRVNFSAATAGSDTGTLTVHSNDPGGDETADQNGEGTYFSEASESFTEPGVPPVDVMLLIDQSCSMADDNTDDVRNGIPDFITELQRVSDWQLVLVTDGQSGCATGGIIDASTRNPADIVVNNAFPGYGFNPGLTEALLELADRALSKTGPGDCNEGFLRPGALLHVIILSDEREQSGNNGQYWVNQLSTYVTDPEFLKVSGVLDINTACGDGSGPDGYDDAVSLTGGSVLNICNANWGAQFSDIASEILAGIRTYNLSETPDPSSVIVTVNGNPTNDFDVTDNNVTINSPPVGEGDVVDIEYGVLAECN